MAEPLEPQPDRILYANPPEEGPQYAPMCRKCKGGGIQGKHRSRSPCSRCHGVGYTGIKVKYQHQFVYDQGTHAAVAIMAWRQGRGVAIFTGKRW
jgi:DnaJ-class molecular chaperone